MLSWSPEGCPTHRVTWYGGQSTQIHFEILQKDEWRQVDIKTLNELPAGVKKFQEVLSECYQDFVC